MVLSITRFTEAEQARKREPQGTLSNTGKGTGGGTGEHREKNRDTAYRRNEREDNERGLRPSMSRPVRAPTRWNSAQEVADEQLAAVSDSSAD